MKINIDSKEMVSADLIQAGWTTIRQEGEIIKLSYFPDLYFLLIRNWVWNRPVPPDMQTPNWTIVELRTGNILLTDFPPDAQRTKAEALKQFEDKFIKSEENFLDSLKKTETALRELNLYPINEWD